MAPYLRSFDEADVVFTDEELPDVARDANAVADEAKGAGVWVFGGG